MSGRFLILDRSAMSVTRAFLFLLVGLVAWGTGQAAASDWVEPLAMKLTATPDTAWSDLNVVGRLSPVVSFGQAACSTARLPVGGGLVPVETSITLYSDVDACNRPSTLLTLQLYLHPVASSDRARLIRATSRLTSRPCFVGEQVLNKRSRAKPAHVTAWRLGAYVLAVAAQPELPDAFAVSIVSTALSRPLAPGVRATWSSLLNGLPTSCR